ncbi:Hpt domain-containing protein [Fulvimarina manganoxydans]|uniref:Hpt domain-containing protein n=1 Tax=Fulvimarina manganoxydans TaxID=937218 RepID=A0A1W2ESF9_9HYPH|nr:Hpt domain-containing protein [Fulvimarina manganoxydans]SMD12156.1 Hpt domain-containing protein [Fulvimarina manganoxydans]
MSAVEPNAAFQAKMTKLRDRFRERAIDQYHTLRELSPSLNADLQNIEAVRVIAHSLAGSAGLFGFEEVARQAASLEDRIVNRAGLETVSRYTDELCSLLHTSVVEHA